MENVKLKLEKWVNGGHTLGHYDGHPVFVTGGIPGEEVEINIDKAGKKEWFGTVRNVLVPSPNRLVPDCEVYIECGGCSYRHIEYERELEVKKSLLVQLFPELSHILEIIKGPSSHYRNNVQWQIGKQQIGFFAKQSHIVIEKSKFVCENLDSKLLWSEISSDMKKRLVNGKQILLRLTPDKVVNYDRDETLMKVNGYTLRVPERGFFQVNQFLIKPWLDKMFEWLGENSTVLELFCGSGTIGIVLSKKISKLIGFESHAKSIECAKKNVFENKILNYEYHVLDLYMKTLPESAKDYKTWIVNPPRSGLTGELVKNILKFKPHKIMYSSCNSSALKRDSDLLIKAYYQITKMVLIDFFPRTPHYEVLTCFELSE